MNDDQSLADPTPNDGATVFGTPNARPIEHLPVRMLTVEDVLASAKLPEKRARVCLRADLQAEYDDLVAQLSTLVDVHGEFLDDDSEAAIDDVSARDRATELSNRISVVRRQMAESMWLPLFRGMCTDDLAVFNKQHQPKSDPPSREAITEYNTRLVAECSVEPVMSVDEVRALRKKLGAHAIKSLVNTAHDVCTTGGVDVPKLPGSLLNLTQQ